MSPTKLTGLKHDDAIGIAALRLVGMTALAEIHVLPIGSMKPVPDNWLLRAPITRVITMDEGRIKSGKTDIVGWRRGSSRTRIGGGGRAGHLDVVDDLTDEPLGLLGTRLCLPIGRSGGITGARVGGMGVGLLIEG